MDMPSQRPVYMDYLFILLGTALMAVAINTIFDPINLVTGGITGAAIIIKEYMDIPLWLTNLILNIPLFLLALKIKGVRFIGRTFFATAALSAWLYAVPTFTMVTGDYVLAAIFGGAIGGIGMGLVFLARATTGGTDMLAAVMQHYLKHYTVAQIMQVLDGLIVITGAFVFGLNKALYAIIAIFVIAQVTDGMIEGLKFSKIAYIISDHQNEIARVLMKELDRGVTGLDARGMYSNEKKNVLFCVVNKKEIVQVKEIVTKIDAKAFIVVSDAREVLGEGFIEIHI